MSATGNCCGCGGCGSCSPQCTVRTYPCNFEGSVSLENVNLIGVGVADSQDGNALFFRGVASANSSLTVTYDPGNHAIIFTLDIDAIVDDLPDATTTQRGVLETATDAEAIAKVATDKILTPSNLAALGASQTFAGLVELATNAETQAGLSTTLAVTPAGLASVTALIQQTTTFADAVARNAAVPAFAGQVGVQLDSDVLWIARGTSAGDFDRATILLGSSLNIGPASQTLIDLSSQDFIFTGGNLEVAGDTFTIGDITPTDFNIGGSAVFQIAGANVGNRQLIGSDNSGASTPEAYPVANFLSTYNVETGWGTPSGTLARTTFATYAGQVISNPPTQAEVQAIDDALVIVSRRLGALITDILARNLPAP